MNSSGKRWVVGISGASGMRYALRLIEVLAEHVSEVHVVVSDAALRVLAEEEQVKVSAASVSQLFPRVNPEVIHVHSPKDIGASIASGSFPTEGMVIVPCSMSTLGALAHGVAQNLLHRAAEVTMKEGRKLVIVPRETPLTAIHLRNMLTLAEMGVRVVPAMPGFYHQPRTIEELVDMMVMRILDAMGIETNMVPRWRQTESVRSVSLE